MTKWEAITEIVKSFNSRGSPRMAFASLVILIGVPSGVIAYALTRIPEHLNGSLNQLITWAGG
jgi:hypothetical protein